MDSSAATLLAAADLHSLGRRIRVMRTARGLTQAQLADDAISIAYVSRIEAGQRRPDLRVLTRICERLGVAVSEMLTGVESDEADRLRLTLQYAELALMSGEAVEAEAQVRAALDVLDARPPGPELRHAQWILARSLEGQGRLHEAVTLLERLRGGNEHAPTVTVAIALSRCYREAGDLARAIEVGEQALGRLRSAGLPGGDDEIQLVVTLAAAYFERGDVVYATSLCAEAVQRADAMGTPAARAAAYWNASVMQSRRGETRLAVQFAQRALALLSEANDDRNLGRLRAQLGVMLLRQDPPDVAAAENALQQARAELTAADASIVDIAHCDLYLARARLATGDLADAERLAEQAVHNAPTAPLTVADAQSVLGRVAAAREDATEAVRWFRRAVHTLTGAQADRNAAQLWYELGDLLDRAGDAESARDAYRSAAAAVGLRAPAADERARISPDGLR